VLRKPNAVSGIDFWRHLWRQKALDLLYPQSLTQLPLRTLLIFSWLLKQSDVCKNHTTRLILKTPRISQVWSKALANIMWDFKLLLWKEWVTTAKKCNTPKSLAHVFYVETFSLKVHELGLDKFTGISLNICTSSFQKTYFSNTTVDIPYLLFVWVIFHLITLYLKINKP